MKIDNTPEEWEKVKEKYKELYLLHKSPDWTIEKQLKLNDEINDLVKITY